MAKTLRNRYSKSLEGLNAQGFFGESGVSVGVTAATDLAGFINAGVEGSIAVIDAADNSVHTGALVAGDSYFFAQIVDGELKKSTVFATNAISTTATAFDAPVLMVQVAGFNGTSGDLNVDIVGGLQEFVLRVSETTPATQPFPTTEGRAVVRNASTTPYDIASAICNDLTSSLDYENNSDLRGFEAGVLTSDSGANFIIPLVTSGISHPGQIKVLCTADPLQSSIGAIIKFGAAGSLGGAYAFEIVDVDSTNFTITLDRPLVNAIADATNVAETTYVAATSQVGIKVEALAEDVIFQIGVAEDLASADISTNIPWKQGSGAPWQVASMEKETQVFAGETTQNEAFREDFGRPTSFVDAEASDADVKDQYSLWFIKYQNRTDSMAFANEDAHHNGYIIAGATDQASSNLAAQLATQFGTPA
jgi:hypothetical protein